MHMISGISVLAIHHLDGEPLGVGAAVGAGQLCFVAETRISGSQAPGDGLAC